MLEEGATILRRLVVTDDWLPNVFATSNPQRYQQHLLYCDPQERFSVVSFVWAPGQKTPVHNHTVWGLVGILRGAEDDRHFHREPTGLVASQPVRLTPGTVATLSPRVGDIHQVANAFDDRDSVSIHVYGGNIGSISRHIFIAETGDEKPFISGYCNMTLPNAWTSR